MILRLHGEKQIFLSFKKVINGCEMYNYCCKLAKSMGWEFGGQIAGHLIGHFPHEKLEKENKTNISIRII